MKNALVALSLVTSILASACTTHVAAAPASPRRHFVHGRWVVAPSPRSVWVPAHYVVKHGKRVLIAGHWR